MNDQVVELTRLLEASDAVDMARGPLLGMRDALSDALDAAADDAVRRAPPPRRRSSHFEARIEKKIAEAVRDLVRDRRPSSTIVPFDRAAAAQEPNDAEAAQQQQRSATWRKPARARAAPSPSARAEIATRSSPEAASPGGSQSCSRGRSSGRRTA